MAISGVVPVAEMRGEDEKELEYLRAAHKEAEAFLLGQKWCFGLGEQYFGCGIGKIVCIFLMELDPVPTEVDRWLWVVVGDLPPAYLVLDACPTPIEALKSYVVEMRRWIEFAYEGITSPDVIPTNTPSTAEYAEMLESRLNCLADSIIPELEQWGHK
ncbi:MAG TPA: hypothetical protein VIX42_01620 [Edaphobacter sp.]